MRARTQVLHAVLLLASLLTAGCPPARPASPDAGPPHSEADGGHRPDTGPEDGAVPPPPPEAAPDAGPLSGFSCDVSRQQGCDGGARCFYTPWADGGVGSGCFEGACDEVAQDCPGTQRCAYVLEDGGRSRQCVEEGTSGEGEPCSQARVSSARAFDTCREGLACVDVPRADGGTAFLCRRLCQDDARCAAPQQCNQVLRLGGTAELPRVCGAPSARCELLARDCASPLGCYPSRTPGVAVCTGLGGLMDGAACEVSNQCAQGSACVGPASARACRALCRHPTGEPGCGAGTSCQPLPDFPGVGACVP